MYNPGGIPPIPIPRRFWGRLSRQPQSKHFLLILTKCFVTVGGKKEGMRGEREKERKGKGKGKEREEKEREEKERKGKGRKGKERKGKERKGKERKGKERKGKERKGKERKGKERKGKREKKKSNQATMSLLLFLSSPRKIAKLTQPWTNRK